MTWTKLDDRLHSHPKALAAWHSHRASLGLHLLALSYAGAHLTDGHVPEVFVRTQLPSAAERRRAVQALVDAGLWEPDGRGWAIHDYMVDNPPREKVLERRSGLSEARAENGRKGASKRWQNASSTNGKPIAPGVDGKRMPPTRPVPDLFPSAS